MALPIAHATAGYLVHRVARGPAGGSSSRDEWRRAAAFIVIGNLPDADFLVGFLLGQPGAFHRGVSHTVLAAVAFGIAAGVFVHWRWRECFGAAALAFGAAYLSHLVLDYLTIDTRPPAGVQLLWPFSSAYYMSPVTLFTEIWIDGKTRAGFLRTVLDWPTVRVLARELMISAGALGALYGFETWLSRVRRSPAPVRAAARPSMVLRRDTVEEDLA